MFDVVMLDSQSNNKKQVLLSRNESAYQVLLCLTVVLSPISVDLRRRYSGVFFTARSRESGGSLMYPTAPRTGLTIV